MDHKLFYHSTKKDYYCVSEEPIICFNCKEVCKETIIFREIWSRKNTKFEVWCCDCIPNMRSMGIVDEYKVANIRNTIPPGAIPAFQSPPILVTGRYTDVFEAADNKEDCEIIDKTRLSGRESWQGASIGNDFKDTSTKDVDLILDAKPSIEHKQNKQNGDEKNE